jgi:hypothetical protein
LLVVPVQSVNFPRANKRNFSKVFLSCCCCRWQLLQEKMPHFSSRHATAAAKVYDPGSRFQPFSLGPFRGSRQQPP